MSYNVAEIVFRAENLMERCDTRDPYKIARQLGIEIIPSNFKKQKGAYIVIKRNRFILVKQDLHPVMKRIVIAHELAHDDLHRDFAQNGVKFQEFNIFDMRTGRHEYEANVFASHLLLDDKEFLDYANEGYDTQQIACAMNSDINLVSLKADIMIAKGYRLYPQEHRNDFLK